MKRKKPKCKKANWNNVGIQKWFSRKELKRFNVYVCDCGCICMAEDSDDDILVQENLEPNKNDITIRLMF